MAHNIFELTPVTADEKQSIDLRLPITKTIVAAKAIRRCVRIRYASSCFLARSFHLSLIKHQHTVVCTTVKILLIVNCVGIVTVYVCDGMVPA